ncbi:MAG: phosphotransferase enzyme family protein [Gammaproteobacteria bacterium]
MRGSFVSGHPHGSGRINDTYVVIRQAGQDALRYLLQRINPLVFKQPELVMQNICCITRHLRRVLEERGVPEVERRCLQLVPTTDGSSFYRDPSGACWRSYRFIDRARTWDTLENEEQAYAAAKCFGEFQYYLRDLPAERLRETIPDFHHTLKHYQRFEQALAGDPCGRAASAQAEIEFARENRSLADILPALRDGGEVPLRLTHNDTKLNNLLFDTETSRALCVVDLDTVMPGLSLYDFGDLVRSCTNRAGEEALDLSRVRMHRPFFEALAEGYLAATRGMMNQTEADHMAIAGPCIAYELGLRFLTDHLVGDVYFKTQKETQNLVRARVQFKLVESMLLQHEAMKRTVARIRKKCGFE